MSHDQNAYSLFRCGSSDHQQMHFTVKLMCFKSQCRGMEEKRWEPRERTPLPYSHYGQSQGREFKQGLPRQRAQVSFHRNCLAVTLRHHQKQQEVFSLELDSPWERIYLNSSAVLPAFAFATKGRDLAKRTLRSGLHCSRQIWGEAFTADLLIRILTKYTSS